jgi:diguanylate cyclase (GGDEF)-like protein/putative nucleotidyltransferase with HDIG domain
MHEGLEVMPMTRRAWAYVLAVVIAGAVLGAVSMRGAPTSSFPWPTFVTLALVATLAQLFKARAPGHQSYHVTLLFLFASLLLLPPSLFTILVLIAHLTEWAKERLVASPRLRAWYLQPFNMSMHIVAGCAARWVCTVMGASLLSLFTPESVLAVSTGALVYVLVNHLLTGLALVLARGVSWRESGVLDIENLLTDMVLLWLGYIVAALWKLNPLLTLPALSPLVLMYRALTIPQLQKEARTDGKTGLLNAGYFIRSFTSELERATRFNRPLAIIMGDLDLLRNINNTYGHLAGDQVLGGIGRIIRETIGEYDVAGRFGGEEFTILLPEAEAEEARSFAERLRQAVESTRFDVTTSSAPIQVTMSLGVACFPQDATGANDLIHEADVAVYQAKLRGRNCVACASDVPHSVRLDSAPLEARLTVPCVATLVPRPEPTTGSVGSGADHCAEPEREEATSSCGAQARQYPREWLWLFVGGVILLGVGLSIMALFLQPRPDLATMALLTALALGAQLLQLKNLYGASSVSVSAGINFSAGLIAGLPGVSSVSGVIAGAHALQRRPAVYKIAFNWATHVVAGSVPALAMRALGISWRVENLLLLALPTFAAALLYYIIETGLVATAISLCEGSSIVTTWRERYGWLAEHYVVLGVIGLFLGIAYLGLGLLGIIVFTLPVLMMHYAQRQYIERTERSVRELRRMNEELSLANREVLGASQAIQQLNEELSLTIGKITDARDPHVSSHAGQVADYAVSTAIELGLPPQRVAHLRRAGLLHDIGKIGIPERILHKPGSLTPEEYEQFKAHTTLGGELLQTCQGLKLLASFVKHHHEWFDGGGYPDGLRGDDIPLEARILAVCDAVDAMASDRPYRRALPLGAVVRELRRCAGTQFDPSVVEAFCRLTEREGDRLITNSAQKVEQAHRDRWSVMRHGLPASSPA